MTTVFYYITRRYCVVLACSRYLFVVNCNFLNVHMKKNEPFFISWSQALDSYQSSNESLQD